MSKNFVHFWIAPHATLMVFKVSLYGNQDFSLSEKSWSWRGMGHHCWVMQRPYLYWDPVKFFSKFIRTMRKVYGDEWIHPPRTEEELESVLNESTRRGFPVCVGFMDGVHVQWDMCTSQWRWLFRGKYGSPSIGWQCTVNHHRRFISVGRDHLGSLNDKTSYRYDEFLKQFRNHTIYNSVRYKIFREDGTTTEETGLWLNVDGGYIYIPELLVDDPNNLNTFMNFWNHFMESERKHVECGFDILKTRFHILKLLIQIHDFDQFNTNM